MDVPDEIQPEIQVSFRIDVPGALEFLLPGNDLRRTHGLPELDLRGVRLLSEIGWINPLLTGAPSWRLPAPNPLDGFVSRYAEALTETCLAAFEVDARHLLIEFVRETPPGHPKYLAPLPFLLREVKSTVVVDEGATA